MKHHDAHDFLDEDTVPDHYRLAHNFKPGQNAGQWAGMESAGLMGLQTWADMFLKCFLGGKNV